jgi:hypothetical protein
MVGFDQYRRTFPVDLTGNWLSASGGPPHIAQAPRLWRTAAREDGVRMQMSLAEDLAPESYRSPVDRADFEEAATRIDAALAHGLTVSFAAHGASTDYRENDAVGHLDFVNSELSVRLTREVNDLVSLSFLAEQGEAPGGANGALSERAATAARASFDLFGQGLDVTFGRVQEQTGVLGLSWATGLGDTPSGETQFAGVDWRFAPGAGWRVNVGAEYGVADLAGSGWLDVEAPLHTSAYSLQASHELTPGWFDPFGVDGEGSLTLSVSQPLRVEDGVLSFMAPTATKYGLRSLRYERREFAPTPSGREIRFGLGYAYGAGETLSAFGEALYVMEPGHVATADEDAILRFGLRVAR